MDDVTLKQCHGAGKEDTHDPELHAAPVQPIQWVRNKYEEKVYVNGDDGGEDG